MAENLKEVERIKSLYLDARIYLDVCHKYDLLRKRAMYAHCIWLDDTDRRCMAETGTAAALCSSSNFFLGSGLFDFSLADQTGMSLSLATGGETSFSMLQTMNKVHKVARMSGYHLSSLRMFYMATLGAARSMQLEGIVGSFSPSNEADFIVLDLAATPLLKRRIVHANALEEILFALAMLGDDRAISATYIAGACKHQRNPSDALSQ